MAEGNGYEEMFPFSCASFAINADTVGNTADSPILVAQCNPSSNNVEAVADFIRFGAEIAKIAFTDVVELTQKIANALPMVHLCKTIEDCHSDAKLHILSSILIFIYHFRYILGHMTGTVELAQKELKQSLMFYRKINHSLN